MPTNVNKGQRLVPVVCTPVVTEASNAAGVVLPRKSIERVVQLVDKNDLQMRPRFRSDRRPRLDASLRSDKNYSSKLSRSPSSFILSVIRFLCSGVYSSSYEEDFFAPIDFLIKSPTLSAI